MFLCQPIYRDTRKPHPTANTTAVTATAGHIFGSCKRQKEKTYKSFKLLYLTLLFRQHTKHVCKEKTNTRKATTNRHINTVSVPLSPSRCNCPVDRKNVGNEEQKNIATSTWPAEGHIAVEPTGSIVVDLSQFWVQTIFFHRSKQ